MKFRMERINLEIKNDISKIISNMNNSKLEGKFITISEVKTSPDLYYSRVSISILGNENETKEVVKILNQSKGYIKKELAKLLKIKRIPDLEFVVDFFEQNAAKIDELFEKIKK